MKAWQFCLMHMANNIEDLQSIRLLLSNVTNKLILGDDYGNPVIKEIYEIYIPWATAKLEAALIKLSP